MGITLIGGTIQLIIAGSQLASTTLEFYQHHLEKDVLVIANSLSEPLGHFLEGESPNSDLTRLIATFQHDTSYDYILTDHDRRVIAYSSENLTPSNILDRTPEFEIRPSERIGANIRADATGADRLYVASQIIYENRTIGYIILNKPMNEAYAQVTRRWLELGIATLPVLGLVIIASWWVSKTISHPLQELRNSALKIADGALDTRLKVTTHDEIGELGHTLNFMAERLEDLMKTQRSFVSNAAHELRTPLMMLKLRAEALQDATLPDSERVTYANEIGQEVEHMAKLVSGLLTLARLDEGKPTTTSQPMATDAVSLLHDVARHWRIEAGQKGVNLTTTFPDQLPHLPISNDDLRVILDNLLENAVKYTHKGSIHLTIEKLPHAVQIQVRDSGIGFTETQGDQLFTRFYRTEQARTHAQGTGLGLSIVNTILENAHGTIEATSKGEGMGATFTVKLAY